MDKTPKTEHETRTEIRSNAVIRFAGDSGDGMQLTGTLFSDVSAILGNKISTFPDYPAEIRAPKGSLGGVSGYQVQIGTDQIQTPGDFADILVVMNPSALKVNAHSVKPNGTVIFDADSFSDKDLKKGDFTTENPFEELGLTAVEILPVPITSMVKESLKESGLDLKSIDRCKNMFALGLLLWLFEKDITPAESQLQKKFGKKEEVLKANLKVLVDGYNYGHNTHLTARTYRIEGTAQEPGLYADVNGNKATALGLVAAAETAGLELFLGSYPITPATDILHELSKLKHLGVKTVQAEDEIAGVCTAVGASYAGALGVTTTSGPGLALKTEAIGFAVMAELPLVVVDVMRSGPSTGMPTKSEQGDLLQALYGRNGESPLVVMAATSPTDCFDSAYMASKLAVEYMTPVILLTDAYIANGSSAWRIPDLNILPTITPPYPQEHFEKSAEEWTPYLRNSETLARYWAIPGTKGYAHRVGGLEKDPKTGAITTNPQLHDFMVRTRDQKVKNIAKVIPHLEVHGDPSSDTILVGWGSTYGHNLSAMQELRLQGVNVAVTHFKYISPLPENTEEVLKRYKRVIIVEQSLGQFARYLGGEILGLNIHRINKVEGQPFRVQDICTEVLEIIQSH